MNTLLRRVIGEDIELTTTLDWNLGRVKADHSQLDQVIMNLAVNARDAMPQGGKLTIKTENVALDEVFERQHSYPVKRGRYVCLTVTDTGIGMNAETKAKAFEPFFTTKERGKGTGLGLSTVYGVVKQSGGYIDVESAPGEGTSFQIYLPQTEEGVTTEKLQAESTQVKAHQTILLAEDEDSLRALTRNTLQGRGYTVLEAKNGVDALKIGRKYVGSIDLLLTDVVMPEMGGHELAQQLIRERPGIKVVYISGYTAQLPGMKTFFLMKPFTRDALTQKIREALETSIAAVVSKR
jgi:two-component system, cell cycle sensor histidine kinase and response regulator CckA